jgi:hypothetical protein
MALQVLDSGNIDAIVRDATGEGLTPPPLPAGDDPAPAKDAKLPVDGAQDPDDQPGDDGLTPREKREFSQKMQRSIAKRVRQVKEAEEFAAEEFRSRRQAEQRADALERELQGLRAAAPAKAAEPTVDAKAKPDRTKFATDGEYIQALVDHGVAESLAKEKAEQAKARVEAEQKEILAAASARIAKAIDLVPDFQEVTEAADVEIPSHVAGYMQQSDMFAEIGYFLAKNPEIVTALQKMTPAKQLVEIGKIEGKLAPFAPAASNGADAKGGKNGATPSDKQEPDGKPQPKAAPRAAAAGDGAAPSAARRAAPVITPISTTGAGSGDLDLENGNVRDHITDFHKRKGTNLLRRQRH